MNFSLYKNLCVGVLSVALLFLMCNGCSKTHSRESVTDYINNPDNGLTSEIVSGVAKISITYKPDFLLKEFSDSAEVNYPYQYYSMKLSLNDRDIIYQQGNSADLTTSIRKINFQLSNYVFGVVDSKDTVLLSDYHVPNFYGMGGHTQLLLAFPEVKNYEKFEIHLNEIGLGTGKQIFSFRRRDIEKISVMEIKDKNS